MLLVVMLTTLAACTTSEPRGAQTTTTGGIALARQEMRRHEYRSALDFLSEARRDTDSDRERAEIGLLSGDCHLALEDYPSAINSYFRGRTANHTKDETTTYLISLGLGKSYEAQDRWASAERHLLEAVSFSKAPDLQDRALMRLGKGSLSRGRLDRALGYHNKIHDRTTFGFPEFAAELKAEQDRRGSPKATKIPLPTVLAPEILSRSVWRAKSIEFAGHPEPMKKPWRITVHHAASPEIPPTAMNRASAQMRAYQKFHQGERKWADIGYHYMIDGAGRIWEGREMRWQGAHAGNNKLNGGNIGVCLMGNFVAREPTPSQRRALKQLLSWLCESHKIHPHFVAGHRIMLKDIPGKSTLCPGARLEAYLNRIKPHLPRPKK